MLYTYDGNTINISKAQDFEHCPEALAFVRSNSIQSAESYLVPAKVASELFELHGEHMFTPGCESKQRPEKVDVAGELFAKLHSYQIEGVNFLLKRVCAVLADDMGLLARQNTNLHRGDALYCVAQESRTGRVSRISDRQLAA